MTGTTSEHRDIEAYRALKEASGSKPASGALEPLDVDFIRGLFLEAGADDCGIVAASDPAATAQAHLIEALLPGTRTLVSFVCRMNRTTVRTTVRSVVNEEFHQTYDQVNDVARDVVRRLEDRGIRAINPAAAFPMEAQNFPTNMQTISHKPLAEAAGMGRMGLHRNVIHPKFGSFILLGTVLIENPVTQTSTPLDYSPCLDCRLCVAACPVEAIGADGTFNFSACYTHNYREFMGGFTDWVHEVADAENAEDYDRRVSHGETVSMWQSLSFKPGYKAAYCLSVCPAGTDVLGPYVDDRIEFRKTYLDPLLAKQETVFVLEGSDAADSVPKRFPHKQTKPVDWTIESDNAFAFLFGLTLTFQRRKARGLDAVIHLTVTGKQATDATLTVAENRLTVDFGAPETPVAHLLIGWEDLRRLFQGKTELATLTGCGAARVEGHEESLARVLECFPRYRVSETA